MKHSRHSVRMAGILFRLVLLVSTGAAGDAGAVPLELVFTGQLVDDGGSPIVNLSANAPSNAIGAIRLTFWTAQAGGTPVDVDLLASSGGAGLTKAGVFPSSCVTPFLPSCQATTLNANGVFQIGIFLNAVDFNKLFPDSSASNWIQTELVYVDKTTAAVTAASSPAPTRQRFTVAPYAMKVPVDGTTVTYNAFGQLQAAAAQTAVLQTFEHSTGASTYQTTYTNTVPAVLSITGAVQAYLISSSAVNAGVVVTVTIDGVICNMSQSFESYSNAITFFSTTACIRVIAPGTHTIRVYDAWAGSYPGMYGWSVRLQYLALKL